MAVADSTIRIDTALKERLERLRARLETRMRQRLSQQEVLRRMLVVAEAEPERLEEDRPPTRRRRMTPDQLKVFLARQPRDYPPTDSAKIDEVLYGGDRP